MSTPTPDVPSGGNPSGNGQRGRRNNGRRNDRNGQNPTPVANAPVAKAPPAPSTAIKELGPHYFECHGERPSRPQYQSTVAAIKAWATLSPSITYPQDLAPLFLDEITDIVLLKPALPAGAADPGATINQYVFHEWKTADSLYERHAEALTHSLAALRTVIWAQCSDAMKCKVRSLSGFASAEQSNDCFWFLQSIKNVMHQFDSTSYPLISLLSARLRLLTCKQRADEPLNVYQKSIEDWAQMIESYGGTVAETPLLLPNEVAPTPEVARDRTLAALFVTNADPIRFSVLKADLANRYIMNNDEYPKDLDRAYAMFTNYVIPTPPRAARPPAAPTTARPSVSPAVRPPL